jgi:hypothetical protein
MSAWDLETREAKKAKRAKQAKTMNLLLFFPSLPGLLPVA